MGSKLNPYLSFRSEARQAMEFYQSVLGGELNVVTFGDFGQAEGGADLVMHSSLVTPAGYTLFAADTPPGMDLTSGSQITVSISGDDVEELRGYFRGLSVDGQVHMPLQVQAWGDEFGMVVDRFGIPWMVNIGGTA
ncbi:VOC family protein [Nocardioides sp. BP30]|uniref:VOC family protein n=1 Tax=Nocardioides sp. BP30 TaxID=3036374 RepID=UPI0024693E8C|nr:VOC family protein [Nocardioides sp. BP30]WGL52434.1 VOC family protein [Nocardioides sp. BP30]